MIDLDNFKYINDTYGHIAGDRALKRFADTLKKCADRRDIVCRIGGDEFVVFYTDKIDRDELDKKAQEMLSLLTEVLREMGYGQFTSVSVGVALHPYDGTGYEALYSNADKALYYVKKNGKNAYSFYSEEQQGSLQNATKMDLDNIRFLIEGQMREENGVFHVDYEEFEKIYSYISRFVKRNQQLVQLLLFTLSANEKSIYGIVPDEAMNALEISVVSSLRMVDVGTRYSSVQYMVLLLDTDEFNGKKVAERVINKFYKNYSGGDVDIVYDIQTMQTKGE